MKKPDFSIVLPAFNEKESLPHLLGGLRGTLERAKVSHEIIVVDNGSIDGTQELLRELKKEIKELRTVRIEKNIGFGNGVLQGLAVGRGQVLGYMNADGQVSPEDVLRAYLKLRENHLDLCRGIRVEREDGFVRKGISKVYNFLFVIMFRCPFKDINGSPKIFTRSFYEKIKPSSRDWFIDAEISIQTCQNDFSVGEIPIISREREKGNSKVSIIFTSFEFLKNMIYWFLFKKYGK